MSAQARALESPPQSAAAVVALPRPRLSVADVALFYGERSGGIRTYLNAKVAFAQTTRAFEHHLIVPGRRERHDGTLHEVRSLTIAASNGYRVPLGTGALEDTLRTLAPDVILVHDPFWALFPAARVGAELDIPVVAVHHASGELNAAGLPGPEKLYTRLFRRWLRRGYRRVDAVMSAIDATPDGRAASVPLRFGLDPAFAPRTVLRRDHVLYVGRIAREKGVFDLLAAAAQASWPLRMIGCGPALAAVESRARRLGIAERLEVVPFVSARAELARAYAEASCVVMPGRHETFGLVGLEAAASGGALVACSSAPSAAAAPELATTYAAGDVDALVEAIAVARARPRDLVAAARLAREFTWERAFEAELRDLERIVR